METLLLEDSSFALRSKLGGGSFFFLYCRVLDLPGQTGVDFTAMQLCMEELTKMALEKKQPRLEETEKLIKIIHLGFEQWCHNSWPWSRLTQQPLNSTKIGAAQNIHGVSNGWQYSTVPVHSTEQSKVQCLSESGRSNVEVIAVCTVSALIVRLALRSRSTPMGTQWCMKLACAVSGFTFVSSFQSHPQFSYFGLWPWWTLKGGASAPPRLEPAHTPITGMKKETHEGFFLPHHKHTALVLLEWWQQLVSDQQTVWSCPRTTVCAFTCAGESAFISNTRQSKYLAKKKMKHWGCPWSLGILFVILCHHAWSAQGKYSVFSRVDLVHVLHRSSLVIERDIAYDQTVCLYISVVLHFFFWPG